MTPEPGKADWKAIRRDLLARIQSGVWKPGDLVPREVELAAQYHCTRSTVGRALRDLATAGFLERRRKGGTTVSPNPVRKAPLEVPIIADAIRKSGHAPGYRLLDTGLVRPPADITDTTDGPDGAPDGPMIFLSALHLADGLPHQLEQRWLNPGAVRKLQAADFTETPVDEWLLQNAPLTRATIDIAAVPAPETVARALAMSAGAPTLRITRISWKQSQLIGILHLYHVAGYSLKTSI
ncbi:GntR family transcriptional regulator [Roseicitreum antarcticum]|uniref:Transcriptional regulator, GntR family n=1 Tax=Roseicitreum antarcticum TaxID=564137 RepID=A0A1H2VYE4_9RHOB|nr:GntR family transcriptional regulator [Roseicitreum antarcticum]SDW73024.1 transcriptional regulator, GntR family [Roseicitreum antarcticum]